MKHLIKKAFFCVCLVVVLTLLESCSGCAHRSRRHRERNRERTERRERSRDRHSDGSSDRNMATSTGHIWSESEIEDLIETEDYDRMLNCIEDEIKEFQSVRKRYFKGDMKDKEAKEIINEIEQRYQPVSDCLSKADSEGELNYNQHKKQIKLFAKAIKEMQAALNQLGQDVEDNFR